jgi:hypothetical protein
MNNLEKHLKILEVCKFCNDYTKSKISMFSSNFGGSCISAKIEFYSFDLIEECEKWEEYDEQIRETVINQ